MSTKKLICLLVSLVFLMANLSGELMASEPVVGFPRAEKQISRNPEYVYIKSKEEIAQELFMYALINLGELKFINTYEEYLEAYKKALKAVYSSGK
ncbi:MAG: hypothetical protein GTO12_17775 [Proteobacteria bacterium]|nr:hypothetical protein [Pseudomonadota bacterium]